MPSWTPGQALTAILAVVLLAPTGCAPTESPREANPVLVVAPSPLRIPAHTSEQLTATAVLPDGSTLDVTAQATWSSSDEAIATVSSSDGARGRVTAVAPGTTTVTASFDGAIATAEVTATNAKLMSLVVSPAAVAIPAGVSFSFSALGLYSDFSSRDVTGEVVWSSSDERIASVDTSGTAGTFRGHQVGEVTITATAGSASATQQLSVTAAKLLELELSAEHPALFTGMRSQMTAVGTFSDGSVLPVTSQITWSSSDASVIDVSNASGTEGQLRMLRSGSVFILGELDGIQALLALKVNDIPNTFAAAVGYSTAGGGGGTGTQLLDVDRDGRLDVLGLVFGSLRYYRNLGDGTLGPPEEILEVGGAGFRGSAIGDLNGDGWDDIAVSGEDQSTTEEHLWILLNNHDGTFTPAHDFDPGEAGADVTVAEVRIADVDGDGHADVVVGTSGSDVLDLYWGDASASFAERTELTVTSPESVAVEDFDGDLKPDLAVASNETALLILHNNGDRTFTAGSPSPVAIQWSPGIAAADLDGSGTMDVAVPRSGVDSGFAVLLGDGAGHVQAPVGYDAPGSGDCIRLRIADMNLDGKLDVLCNGDSVGALIWYGRGDGTYSNVQAVTSGGNYPQSAEAVDLNGDLLPDLAVMTNTAPGGLGLRVMLQTY